MSNACVCECQNSHGIGDTIEDGVRWGRGLTALRPGILKLEKGRLSLVSDGREVFGVAVPASRLFSWPWYGMNTSFRVRLGEQKYSVSFMPPGARGSRYQAALNTGARWKKAIEGEAHADRGRRSWIGKVSIATWLLWILLAFMGAVIGLALLASPGGGPLTRVSGGMIMVLSLVRAWMRIRDFRRLAKPRSV